MAALSGGDAIVVPVALLVCRVNIDNHAKPSAFVHFFYADNVSKKHYYVGMLSRKPARFILEMGLVVASLIFVAAAIASLGKGLADVERGLIMYERSCPANQHRSTSQIWYFARHFRSALMESTPDDIADAA